MFPPLEPLRLTLLGVALLTVAFVLQLLVYRRMEPMISAPMICMALFLGVIGLSMVGSYNKGLTLDRFSEIARFVYMSFLIVHIVDTPRRLRGFMTMLVLVMAGLSTAILARYFAFPETRIEGKGGSGGIAGGFLGDGNDYALAQNVVLPWALALLGSARRRLRRWLLFFALAVGVMAVLVTYSRGGFLGLAALFVAYYLGWVIRRREYAKGVLLGALGLGLIVVGVLALAPEDFIERMTSIREYDQDESAMGRIDAWRASRAMFADHTFLGVGAGAFSEAYGKRYKPIDAVSNVWREAHSAFFQTLGELGLLGILTLYALPISIAWLAFRLRLTMLPDPADDRFFHAARTALFASLAGWFVSSLFLSVSYYPHMFMLAMVVSVLQNLSRRQTALPVVEEIEIVEEDET
jgi:probable O-glycosylation ligase (exosortase A-associated)